MVVPVDVDGEARLSLETVALSAVDPGQDVMISLRESRERRSEIEIRTRPSAPSFSGATFRVIARAGDEVATRDVTLDVQAVYLIDVLNGIHGTAFDFSTPAEVARFRPHPEGLVLQFRNLSDRDVTIHGEGAIPHQDPGQPMSPRGGVYAIPPIFPADGADLAGHYTIHNVYEPERDVVFNMSGCR